MDILEWIDYAKDVYSTQLDTKIKVVGVVSRKQSATAETNLFR